MRTNVLLSAVGVAAMMLSLSSCQKDPVQPETPSPVLTLEKASVPVTAEGGQYSVNYEVSDPVEGSEVSVAYPENDWVSGFAVSKTSITFNVAANEEQTTRSLEVTVSYPGADDAKFTISQDAAEVVEPVEYKVNPNWNVSYYGKFTSPSYGLVDVIEVTGVTDAETYYLGVVSVDDFNEIDGGSFANCIERTINNENSMMAMAELFGTPYTWEDILLNGSAQWVCPEDLEVGTDYYTFIFGIDANGTPSGDYAASEVFTPEEVEASDEYNKWIGSWRIEDANGVGYDIEIKSYSANESYLMSGWEAGVFNNGGPEVVVNFDYATNGLAFITNENIGKVTISTGEQVDLGFYGNGDDGYFYTSSYTIANAVLAADGNSAEVTGNTLNYSDGTTVTMVSMQFFGLGATKNYAFSEAPVFPLTMTRVSSEETTSVKSNAYGRAIKAVDLGSADKAFSATKTAVSASAKTLR